MLPMTRRPGPRRRRPRSSVWRQQATDRSRTFLAAHERTFNRLAAVTGLLAVVGVGWLAALALAPQWRDHAPSWLRWFGQPGTAWAALVLAALFALTLLFRWLPHQRWPSASTTVALASLSIAASILGFTSYLHCHDGPAGSGPLRAAYGTLLLFVGASDDLSPACTVSYPAALDLARFLGIFLFLAAAVAAGIKLFRSQIDRFLVRFGGPLTIVVGIEDDVVSMIRDISVNKVPGTRLLVITSNADRDCVHNVRELGARIIELELAEAANLGRLNVWQRARRIYLLSGDPQLNFDRFDEIDDAVVRRTGPGKPVRRRVPLTVRIDDPWHAEAWRRQVMSGKRYRWAPEAVGRYQATATRLAYLIMNRPATPKRIYLACSAPLAYSLLVEFTQYERERRLYDNVYRSVSADRGTEDGLRPSNRSPVPEVWTLGPDADGLLTDHLSWVKRADRTQHDEVEPELEPTAIHTTTDIEGITTVLNDLDGALVDEVAVILERDSAEGLIEGTRLAARFPRTPLFIGGDTVRSLSTSPVVGRLVNFPIALDVDKNVPQDVWERAAILKHELYCIDQDPDTERPSAQAWPDLDDFFKGSNRREILNTLSTVEDKADCTWASQDDPPVGLPGLGDVAVGESSQDCRERAALVGIDDDAFGEILRFEHEDWVDYHYDQGWRSGDVGGEGVARKVRELEQKKSAALVGWDEYSASSGNIDYSARSFIRALQVLGVLGFRPMPQWHHYPRRELDATARRLTEPMEWVDDHGEKKFAKPGDWLVKVDNGDGTVDERTVTDQAFDELYTPVDLEAGTYRRTGATEGRRAIKGEQITSTEGADDHPDTAESGDYIFRSANGDKWRIGQAAFRSGYVDVPTDDDRK